MLALGSIYCRHTVMFYVTLNKRNPVTFPNTPTRVCAFNTCVRIIALQTRSFSKTLLALVAADTQGHAASCTNQVLASTLHQPFGLVSTPSFFPVHYLDRSRSPTMVTILLVTRLCSTMRGRIKGTDSTINAILATVVLYELRWKIWNGAE